MTLPRKLRLFVRINHSTFSKMAFVAAAAGAPPPPPPPGGGGGGGPDTRFNPGMGAQHVMEYRRMVVDRLRRILRELYSQFGRRASLTEEQRAVLSSIGTRQHIRHCRDVLMMPIADEIDERDEEMPLSPAEVLGEAVRRIPMIFDLTALHDRNVRSISELRVDLEDVLHELGEEFDFFDYPDQDIINVVDEIRRLWGRVAHR